jgi:polyisoprenoid-binding protein YceI
MMNIYNADSNHSSAHFNLNNLIIPDIVGDFPHLSGKFIYDPDDLGKSFIEARIDVKSVTTGDIHRDDQLKGRNFFYADIYPDIVFVSKRIELLDEDVLKVSGNLTVKNITKEVILNVERPEKTQDKILNLAASTVINREDFKLELGPILEIGEALVANSIRITMKIELVKE